jgi:hypothetical protein
MHTVINRLQMAVMLRSAASHDNKFSVRVSENRPLDLFASAGSLSETTAAGKGNDKTRNEIRVGVKRGKIQTRQQPW